MSDIDAVRAYRDAWLRSQSLHGYAVVAAADAAIAALEAEVERLRYALDAVREDSDHAGWVADCALDDYDAEVKP